MLMTIYQALRHLTSLGSLFKINIEAADRSVHSSLALISVLVVALCPKALGAFYLPIWPDTLTSIRRFSCLQFSKLCSSPETLIN